MKMQDKLRVVYSKKEQELLFHYPWGHSTHSDGHYLCSIFDTEFEKEMERRGYDVSTLKFSIEPQKGNLKFSSQEPKEQG